MSDGKILYGVRKIIYDCLNVQKNEKVLIITDPLIPFCISQALFEITKEAKGIPHIVFMDISKKLDNRTFDLIEETMRNSDVIITPTSRTVFHSAAMRKARENGARALSLTECDEKTLSEGGIEADFKEIEPTVNKVGEIFSQGKEIELSTPGGTSLKAKIDGRTAHCNSGICHKPGEGMGVPDIEVYIAPVEGTCNGDIVIDASAAVVGIVDEPIKMKIVDGRLESITGDGKAAEIEKILKAANDPNGYNIAEIAVGLNPKAKVIGKIIEDEGVYGTAHCALGDNMSFGGANPAPFHLDFVMWKPTIKIDGRIIFDNGIIQI